MTDTRSLPTPAEWPEHIRAGVRAERLELDVTELALRTVAGTEAVKSSSAGGAQTNTLVLDGHLLAIALEQGTREPQRGFHDLGAEFAYPLAPLLNELRVQGG